MDLESGSSESSAELESLIEENKRQPAQDAGEPGGVAIIMAQR